MSDPISINGNQYSSEIKFKGHKRKIDLNNLMGLKQTDENKSIFKNFDINGNGTIDTEEEVQKARQYLSGIAGDNAQITKKKAVDSEGNSIYSQISALADQQKEITKQKGTTENTANNTETDENGNTTKTEDLGNGQKRITKFNKETNTTTITITDSEGNTIKETTTEPIGKSKQLRKTEHDCVNGTYTESQNALVDGSPSSAEFFYPNDEAYNSGQMSKATYNKGLPTEITQNFEYDANGNVKITQGDTVTYEDKDGNEIQASDYGKPATTTDNTPTPTENNDEEVTQNHEDTQNTKTVEAGDSIKGVVVDALKEQGIENPTDEQIKSATKQFVEANPDAIHTYSSQGKNANYKGNKTLWTGETVNIPQFTGMEKTEDNPETAANENQSRGEVSTGTHVDTQDNPNADTSYGEVIDQADSDHNGTLSLDEFKAIAEPGHDKAMEDAFKQIDTDGDGSITKDELNKGAEVLDNLQ